MQVEAFPNYTQLKPRVSSIIWWCLRGTVFGLTLFVIADLFISPQTGLTLLWQILIPLLPLSFAVVPGLWRNICPMAFVNQLPRRFGLSREYTLSESWRKMALYLSVLAFVVFVVFRHPVLNSHGAILGSILSLALILAFVGGLMFKGRSGWCGTFCPLAPIQKAYGHAPLLLVRNSYCEPCLGCQKNCYDFNPRAAFFSDLGDSDANWVEQRKFFIALLPGLIVGFFAGGFSAELGWLEYLQSMAVPMALSTGIFFALHNLLHINFYRLASIYAMLGLAVFYWFGFPVVNAGIDKLLAVSMDDSVINLLRYTVITIAGLVVGRSLVSEYQYKQGQQSVSRASLGKGVEVLKTALRQTSRMITVEERSSGKQLLVPAGQTLLDVIEANELPIMSGCRMGMCGSDPVVIVDGLENLDPADENELNTLRRLGLEGKARLACCCKPKAGITIDLEADPTQLTPSGETNDTQADEVSTRDRIIIIGNGIAGISTAQTLRELDANFDIVLISNEPYHFYNRMGLESVLYGRTAMQGLYLIKEDWYLLNQVDTWLNTQVTAINAGNKTIALATGETIDYHKLVLATGANALIPDQSCYRLPGVFALRTAEDALSIRQWVQDNRSRRAIVLGGGVLGVEAADALLQLGMKVTIVHTAEHLMNRQLDLHAAVILKTFLANKGIRLVSGAGIASIEPSEDGLKQVFLDDGRQLVAETVLLCIGVRANTELAKSAGLTVNRGVLVDQTMQSSNPDIYCVGDAAELPGAMGGLWSVGSEQGKVAANSILGNDEAYAAHSMPPVQLKVSGIDLRSFGQLGEEPDFQNYSEGDTSKHSWRHLCVKDGLVVGGVFVNSPQAANSAIQASKKAKPLTRAEVESIIGNQQK